MFPLAALSAKADHVFHTVSETGEKIAAFGWLTNSMLFTIIVSSVLILVVQLGLRNVSIIPGSLQNAIEAIVEALYNFLEPIVGKHMIKACFPLLATLFIFILTANWFGLLPGVGTIGYGVVKEITEPSGEVVKEFHVKRPLLRPSNADLNMTIGLALLFMGYWTYWTFRELGVGGFLAHTFGPKGGVTGIIKILLLPIFLFVGVIEVVSILLRLISLPIRLYGNVFAGESLLHSMGAIGGFFISLFASLPFYFLELLIGLLQATVFMLLCAVYIKLSTEHEEGHGDSHHSSEEVHAH
ncbi:MAG: F0F1 ATP synthase subunit A [Candidatus Methylacidiphilales bacterium]